jgi:hypothetical protein
MLTSPAVQRRVAALQGTLRLKRRGTCADHLPLQVEDPALHDILSARDQRLRPLQGGSSAGELAVPNGRL